MKLNNSQKRMIKSWAKMNIYVGYVFGFLFTFFGWFAFYLLIKSFVKGVDSISFGLLVWTVILFLVGLLGFSMIMFNFKLKEYLKSLDNLEIKIETGFFDIQTVKGSRSIKLIGLLRDPFIYWFKLNGRKLGLFANLEWDLRMKSVQSGYLANTRLGKVVMKKLSGKETESKIYNFNLKFLIIERPTRWGLGQPKEIVIGYEE